MKHIALIKHSLVLAVCALAALMTGCIKDDLATCGKLTVRIENIKGNDITMLDMIDKATLYIYDANKKFLEAREIDRSFLMSKNAIKFDGYPDETKLYVIAWANLLSDKQELTKTDNMDDLLLKLNSSNDIAVSPDSLYFGSKEVVTYGDGIKGGDSEVPVRIKVGTYTILTVGLGTSLKSFGLKSASSISMSLTRTLDSYDYQGKQVGDSVYYNPDGYIANNQEWISSGVIDRDDAGGRQNVFAGENLALAVYKDGVLLKVVDKGEIEGVMQPISIKEGERRDFRLEFKEGTISLKMRVSPWGVVDDEIEF